ncbi:Ribosomal large subunit pseudouridine synthase D [Candidatus Izimaplasma bacterium HR1]|jgi:23S rRNA pseudouridine1911/1915/1917 synthase|uniref:RluA family pseudouridine synthase n=1 Tax=Candidatus Izimoplasma sp. HR1 TaxID=1541959 RepID=UPI0004F6CC09|nr:Ribosomal large subunit pseudouridine synthase D [Candidatus Izimaplasma bacterium HR1]
MEEKYIVLEENNFERLDKYLTTLTDHSRSTVQALIKQGNVLVNEKSVKNNYKIKTDDVIVLTPFEEVEVDVLAEDIPIDIVYQDKDLLVVNKGYNMVVHPAPGNYTGTLVNALLYHVKDLDAIKGEIRPGIVHRIDKETSGLLVVAKNAKALEDLSDQLRLKTVTRKYVALVDGVIPHNLGKVNAPIGRDPKNRQKMKCVDSGKASVTNFKVLSRYEDYTLIECVLETGRTHQIRVHLAYIDHPVVGDPKYGRRKTDTTNGQFLHAKTLGFIHPTTKEYMEFNADLPDYFKEHLETLE